MEDQYTMTGGSGLYSYSKNSNFQRQGIETAKELIKKSIAEKLDVDIFSSSSTFRIADLGCATGPNTFVAVQNIIDALEIKCQSQNSQIPEFQVFFNDHASNDFNQLFTTLPPERQYFAMGVPGSFHGRLFPNASLHFVHSSHSLHILSRVPKEVRDRKSAAWNKGRILYSNSADEVVKAYEAQYHEDMESFLEARAQEIVHGGLFAFIIPSLPNRAPHSEAFANKAIELLGSCLVDMANKGKISREDVDSFNFPYYFPSPDEVEAVVKRNGCFNIETIESLQQEKLQLRGFWSTFRGGTGSGIKKHFGEEILDELFDLLYKKFEENPSWILEAINVNAQAIGSDSKYWTTAEEFYPKRFVNRLQGADFEFISFGSGRRICPGISFAIASIELPLAQLLFHFHRKISD